MYANHFGSVLKQLREEAGLTQKQLAERAGLALRTVSSLEQALYEPVWSTVLALAAALGVEVQAFAVKPMDHAGKPPRDGAQLAKRRGRPRKAP
jgi:putative transcriptional regulator